MPKVFFVMEDENFCDNLIVGPEQKSKDYRLKTAVS
jgi:hypothetical protein